MSMSQEEIEALMNGLDVSDNESASEEDVPSVEEEESSTEGTMSEDDIADLIAQTDISGEEQQDETKDDIESLIDNNSVAADEESIDDILAGIDGIADETESKPEVAPDINKEELVKSWTDEKIDQGVFPLPAEDNTKVVAQLSQVADDSEEKASKIFDVLSYILDENNEIQKKSKALDEFVSKQTLLLDSLTKKFPHISVFKSHLQSAQALAGAAKDISSRVDAENMQLFEAMELMQFHDINRQKIERVMSVIRKLSDYLNNIFEDDGAHKEVSVAKHIHGDNGSDIVGNDDLEALISEFAS